MAYRFINRENKLANAQIAQKWAQMPAYGEDRTLKKERVDSHIRAITKGEFQSCTWADIRVAGKTYRVNGKHSSHAIAQISQYSKLPKIHINVEHYEGDSATDIAKLYSTFDSGVSSKITTDIVRVHKASDADFDSVKTNLASKIVSGLTLAEYGEKVNQFSVPHDVRAELLLKNKDFALIVCDIAKTQEAKQLLVRAPVIGAMFKTYQADKDEFAKFWIEVRDGSNPDRSAPSRVLQKYLLKTNIRMGRGRSLNAVGSVFEFYVKCIRAWNAFRNKTTTDLKCYANAAAPKAI